jgi:hypothetical protein
MIIAPMVEVRDVEFFRRLRRQNLGIRPPDAIGAALKAIAAPPLAIGVSRSANTSRDPVPP